MMEDGYHQQEEEKQQLRIVRLRFEDATRLMNLWSGCGVVELRELISAAFAVSAEGRSAPVAIVAEDSGVIVPLSVASAHPHALKSPSYVVLRADGGGVEAAATPRAWGQDDEDDEEEEEEEDAVSPTAESAQPSPEGGEAKVKKLTDLICKFARLMETHGRLTKLEADTVAALASKRDAVALAAYAVAAADQDADFLLELVRKVARDYLRVKSEDDPSSFDGPTEHAVAGQLLRVIDELFVSPRYRGQVDMLKCRYLQRLVLEKDPVLFAAFDVFADDGDLEELFDTLVRVASRRGTATAPPPATAAAAPSRQADDEAGTPSAAGTEGGGEGASSSPELLVEERRLAVFRECMVWLVDKGIVDAACAEALLASAAIGNEELRAALDAYGESGDLETFLETLSSAAKALGAELAASSEPSVDERHAIVFRECLQWLVEKEIVEIAPAEALVRAAKRGDPRIRAAIQAYVDSNDLGRFLETLSVMARVVATADGPADDAPDAPERSTGPTVEVVQDQDQDDEARQGTVDAAAAKGAKPSDDVALKELSELVFCLVDEGKLTVEEHKVLTALLESRDLRLLAAFDVYLESSDLDDLIDTVTRIAKRGLVESAALASPQGGDDDDDDREDDDDDEEEDEDDEDDEDEEDAAPAPGTFYDAFAQIALSTLSPEEAAAIKLCVARNDPDLVAIIQVFHVENDRADFQDSLKRIARKVIEEEVTSSS